MITYVVDMKSVDDISLVVILNGYTYNNKVSKMEYELYLYCTGMGTLIIGLILMYHLLGNDEKQHQASMNIGVAE